MTDDITDDVTDDPVRRRAERLARVYPRSWRDRYGEEFIELLVAEIAERPRSLARTLNVVASGARTRLRGGGITHELRDPVEQAQRGLAVFFAAGSTFFVFGAALWTQVAVGWRWAPPSGSATGAGMVLMCSAAVLTGVLMTLALAPLVWAWLRTIVGGDRRSLSVPALLVVSSGTVLIAGSRHFQRGWPGSGGHPWAYHGLVPAGLGAFVWSLTRGVSTYWVHPGSLASFSGSELAWMAISPVAITTAIIGVTLTALRLQLSTAMWRFGVRLARVAPGGMGVFLAGASAWVFADKSPGPTGIYRVGLIDFIGLAIMSGALALATRAALSIQDGTRRL